MKTLLQLTAYDCWVMAQAIEDSDYSTENKDRLLSRLLSASLEDEKGGAWSNLLDKLYTGFKEYHGSELWAEDDEANVRAYETLAEMHR